MTKPTPDPRDRDEVLEKNVETLLGTAYQPPTLDRAARVRIREALVASGERARGVAPARARRWSPVMMAGAALVAASTLAVVGAQLAGDRGGDTTAVIARDGERLELSDGTVAVVGEGGKVDPIGARHVRVTGQVYLDVVPGKGRFVVDTEHGRLEVLGTRFVVTSGVADTTAAVLRGAVKMVSGGGDVVVHAGQQGTMKLGAVPTRAPAPRLSHLVGWARAARIKAEDAGPRRRSGTLYARDPQRQEQDFPLPMRQLTLDVVVENQVARVAVDQTFHNPRPETLEGVYRFTVPPDAALARLAMYVDGTLMESAVVERQQARRIYEDIVYRRRDPALAEWTGAGRVDMRIFPLVGKQDKRVIVSYTQALPRLYDDWTLTVPMPELDEPVDGVGMTVRIADCGGCQVHSPSHDVVVSHDGDAAMVTYQRAGATVGDSLVLTVRDPDRRATLASSRQGGQQYLLVRSRPELGDGAPVGEHRPRRWVILDDVSASRSALERRAQADLIDRLIDTIDEDDQIAIATFDVDVRTQGDFVRAADIDRRAIRSSLLAERGGVGATDLGVALGEAARLLAATDPRDAYVVYLGDGVVTGGARDLAALQATLVGKATFVGFAVGDGSDVPSLGAIADATGGLVVPVDPADDLAWRALDAVAVLYTPRVVGLRARVLGPGGQLVEGASAHLRGGQLAEGDELEVAIRAPGGAEVAALEIEGSRDGATWTHRIALGDAERVSSAGAVPRLWAQRQVQALILARNTAPPILPCAGEPCPTVEEQRSSYRESLRKEIVALGKQFFLLSPHTSLIVLENDAMYTEYGVTKGVNDGWAPYQVPTKIAVTPVVAPLSAGHPDDVALVRTPVQPFYADGGDPQWGWDTGGDTLEGEWRSDGRGSSGTGPGFGLVDSTSTVLRGATAALAPMGGGAQADPAKASGAKNDDQTVLGGNNAGPVTVPVSPVEITTSLIVSGKLQPADGDELFLDLVTTAELRGGDAGWGGGRRGADTRGRASSRDRGRWAQHERVAGNAEFWSGTPRPVAWNYASDHRLDDLSEFVPAFFAGPLDAAIAELKLAAGAARGSISADARAMLVEARRRVPAGVYRWGDNPDLTVDATGRISWKVEHDTGLTEVASFDGRVLRRRYDELGLVVTRDLAEASPALLLTVMPLLVADPDDLARWYVVTRKDDHTLALAPASAPDAATLELELDDDHHLVAIRSAAGRALITVRWDRGAPVGAAVLGEAVAVSHVASTVLDATAGIGAGDDALVEVNLPLRPPAFWTARLAAMSPGTDEWRRATRNQMASLAATADASTAVASLRLLADAGGIALGDLVLASGGLGRATSDRDLVTLLAAVGDGGRAVGRYLSASRAYGKKPRIGVFSPSAGDGLVGSLARHRETLAHLEAGKIDGALGQLRAGRGATVLRVIAASAIAGQSYRSPEAAGAWEMVGAGAWRNIARYEAGRALYNRGDYAGAASRFVELMTAFDLSAMPVQIDWTAKSAVTASPRGQVGWQLAWSAYRNQVLADGSLAQVMALLGSAMQSGEPDVDRVLGRAAELAKGDPVALADIVARSLALGQVERAAPLLEAALAVEPTPALLRLAAQVAERQGRIADAADQLDRALLLEGDGPVSLAALRADMARLLTLRGRVALLATGAARETALDAAVAIADRWRDVDPDNVAIDRQIGELLLGGGRRDEAWRQLSTAIERHPMEGDGWVLVAEVMEKEGRLDEAVGFWQQAVVIDQTNPTPRLRKAQALFALGRDAEGLAMLDDIVARTWHDRWINVAYQARTMRAQLRPATPAPR